MDNPFSPTTTGGRAGQSVYTELTDKQTNQTASGSASRAAKYEKEEQTRVDNYVVVLEALDKDALSKVNIINNKKQEILNIISNANSKRTPFQDTYVSSESSAQSNSTASKVVYTAGITTFTYDPQTRFISVGQSEIVYKIGVRGPVYPDILAAWYYPKLESLTVDTPFYREGETYIKVTSNNLGIGVTAYEFGDTAGATGSIGLVTTSNSPLGTYYYFSDIDSITPGASKKISDLVSDIETLRTEVSNYLSGISTTTGTNNGTNEIRSLKSNAQVDLWFEKKGQTAVSFIDYSAGLSSLEDSDNSKIIQDYNS